MTVDQLILHLTTMRDTGDTIGDYEVLMVINDDGDSQPVECPVMIGGEMLLYSEKLF